VIAPLALTASQAAYQVLARLVPMRHIFLTWQTDFHFVSTGHPDFTLKVKQRAFALNWGACANVLLAAEGGDGESIPWEILLHLRPHPEEAYVLTIWNLECYLRVGEPTVDPETMPVIRRREKAASMLASLLADITLAGYRWAAKAEDTKWNPLDECAGPDEIGLAGCWWCRNSEDSE